ncbi:hypothetical protein DBR11_19920 [Pedobacter sp. HMWF019]|nr:hypothetical protein DBR11_19920 [Pedobacter sp. HMWF019]
MILEAKIWKRNWQRFLKCRSIQVLRKKPALLFQLDLQALGVKRCAGFLGGVSGMLIYKRVMNYQRYKFYKILLLYHSS